MSWEIMKGLSVTRKLTILGGIAAGFIGAIVVTLGRFSFEVFGQTVKVFHPHLAVTVACLLTACGIWGKPTTSLKEALNYVRNWCALHDRSMPLWLAMFGGALVLRVKILQHFSFNTTAFDLAMYDTAIRNTLLGNFLFSEELGRSFFSEHFSPIILLFVPLYAVWASPVVLLCVTSVGMGASLWFAYCLARRSGLEPLLSASLALILLNNRHVVAGVLFDFHPEVLEIPFFLGLFWAFAEGRPWLYAALLVLALSCKEDVPIYTFMIGLLPAISGHRRIWGVLTMALSVVWAYASWKIVIPAAMGAGAAASHFLGRWSYLGEGYWGVFVGAISSPLVILRLIFTKHLIGLFSPWLFLPLAAPGTMLGAIPGIVLNSLSTLESQASFELYYPAPILPFLFFGSVLGIGRLMRTTSRFRGSTGTVLAAVPAIACLGALTTFGYLYPFHRYTSRDNSTRQVMALIPDGASVSAQTIFVPHLAARTKASLFPSNAQTGSSYIGSDYVFVDISRIPWPLTREELSRTVGGISEDPRYRMVEKRGETLLFRHQELPGYPRR